MKSKKDIDQLIESHKKLIESEAAKYAIYIPSSVVLAEAYKLAHKAAENYDEKSGFKFSTYLHKSLQKLRRISTKYGGTVRLSEDTQFKVHRLNQVEASLREEIGRAPTMQELSDNSGFSLQQVSNLLKSRKKDVSVMNMAYTPVFIEGEDDDWIHFVYHDLNTRDKFIFEHKTGFGGKKVLSNEEIGSKLKLSPSTIANRVNIISTRIAEGMK